MQRYGNDGYCWVVDVKDPWTGRWGEAINGLTRREVLHYRTKLEKEAAERFLATKVVAV